MKQQKGSALLFVLLLISVLGVVVQAWWQHASRTLEVMRLREVHYANLYAMQAVLEYGIAHAKKNFDALVEKKETVLDLSMLCDHLFLVPHSDYSITVSIIPAQKNTDRLEVSVCLREEEHIRRAISCSLERSHTDGRPRFLVKNYSLRTAG